MALMKARKEGTELLQTLLTDSNGNLKTTATVTGDVTIDIDEINAELKVDSGHDLFIAENVTGAGTWTVIFDSVSGLSLEDIQGLENKTTGEVYNTAGATVTTTSIALVSGNNTGKTEPQASDSLELIYRGTSRFDDKATSALQTTGNAILTTIDADTGAIKTSVELIDDAVGTADSAAPTKVIMQGQYAETTVPTAVSDGDVVREWHNEYGQQVIYGANLSSNAIDSNVVNPPELNRIDTLTLLDEVTATGASSATDLTNYNKVKFQIFKTGTATVDIQESLDDTTYDDVQSDVDGIVTISGETLKYIKVNVSAYTSGNVTVKMIAGR